jgi:hypothetical protein
MLRVHRCFLLLWVEVARRIDIRTGVYGFPAKCPNPCVIEHGFGASHSGSGAFAPNRLPTLSSRDRVGIVDPCDGPVQTLPIRCGKEV